MPIASVRTLLPGAFGAEEAGLTSQQMSAGGPGSSVKFVAVCLLDTTCASMADHPQ